MTNTTNKTEQRQEIINEIKQYFEENPDIFNDCIMELDSYNNYLGDSRRYDMYMIDEFFSGYSPLEVLQHAFFGRDDDNGGEFSEFNPNRNYFYFNGYGNLVSTDYIDYSDFLDNYAVEAMIKNRNYIYTIETDDELKQLFDKIDELDEMDGEE